MLRLLFAVLLLISASAHAQIGQPGGAQRGNCALGSASGILAWNAPGCATTTVTLTGNSTLNIPTGANAPSAGQQVTFLITQDATGSRSLTLGSGFNTPNGASAGLSTAASATDEMRCAFSSAIAGYCDLVVKNYTPVVTFTIAHSAAGADCGAGTYTTCAGGSVTFDNTSQLAMVPIIYCEVSGCNAGTSVGITVSSVAQTSGTATSTCVRATGIAGSVETVLNTTEDIFICTATVAGTATYTATFSGSIAGSHAQVVTDVVSGVTTTSPDDGWGASAAVTNSSPTVTSTGTTTQNFEFVYSAVASSANSGAPTPGTGYTAIDSIPGTTGINITTMWKQSGASGNTQTASATTAGNGAVIGVLGIKHP